MSNPALVAPRPASVNTFDRPTSQIRGSIHHSLSVRGAGARRAVSTATRHKKQVPGAPKDVKDALDKLGIGSPKMNGSALKTFSKPPSNKPDLQCVMIKFAFVRQAD